MEGNKVSKFRKFVRFSLFAIYLLILAGALVRVTGSGMGCPDWPRCFEQLVPPTDVSEIRPDYKEYYFRKTGHAIADFNVFHTYTEYINRLIAVGTGILGIITTFLSFAYWKSRPTYIWVSLLILVLLGFEGWLGKLVVNTHLKSFMVTLHMFAALLILFFLIWLGLASKAIQGSYFNKNHPLTSTMAIIMLFLTLIQILLGTQVREEVERIASNHSGLNRNDWLSETGLVFYIHRSISWGMLILSWALFQLIQKHVQLSYITKAARLLFYTFIFQMVTGILMNYFGIPAYAQAIHLFMGSISFGVAAYLILQLKPILLFNQHE